MCHTESVIRGFHLLAIGFIQAQSLYQWPQNQPGGAETGRYDPSLPLAFKLARLFGQAIEQIFQDEAVPAPAQ